MNIELFSNVDEGTNFLNYKAKTRIQNLESVCKTDENDILEYISNCSSIFQKYNKKNLIEEIYNIDKELKLIDTENIDENKINEFKSKREIVTFEFKQFIEELQSLYDNENLDLSLKAKYLSDREDIEFAYKKIINRSLDIHDKKTLISDIENSYPDAHDFDINEFKKNSITFKMINDYLNINKEENEPIEDIDLDNENTLEIPHDLYVVKISEAPDYLKVTDNSDEKEIESNQTNTIENDTSFFGIDDSLTESILNNETPTFDEVEEIKTTPLEDIPLDVDLVPVQDESTIEETKESEIVESTEEVKEETPVFEENNNEPVNEVKPETSDLAPVQIEENNEEIKVEEKNEAPESNESETHISTEDKKTNETEASNEMSYTMDKNDTIYNIALALFQDESLAKKAVEKIIQNNEKVINQRMSEKNITDKEDIANKKEIFSGITLNLTNLFDEVVDK